MPNASISGLASGLDTATIINQLMQIEAISQSRLKSRVDTQQREVNSLQTINAKFASLATKAKELTAAEAFSPLTASSSHEHVTATADAGTMPGSFSFIVTATATAHQVTYSSSTGDKLDMSTVIATPDSDITINVGTTSKTVNVGDGTLQSVITAINGTGLDVQASAMRTDNGHVLRVAATKTGEATQFTIAGLDQMQATSTVTGASAKISFAGTSLSSSTNTFTDVMPGLDITVSAAAVDTVTVTVARDPEKMTESVKALVDIANAALTETSSLTAYGVDGKAGGMLAGDSTLREVRDRLLSVISAGVGGKTLASVGIELNRDGTIDFDAEKFESTYSADPTGTAALFQGTDGLATRMHTIADDASDSTTGSVTLAIKGRNTAIDRMEDDIADWDVRLDLRRRTLERQYAALEVALQGLQSQSQWLAGQIAGLPSYDSGS